MKSNSDIKKNLAVRVLPPPWQVIKKAKHILKCIISSSLVTTALCSSSQVIGKKAGDLTSQTRMNSFCWTTCKNDKKSQW